MMAKKAKAQPSETIQVISEQHFKTLVRAVKNADADIGDAQDVKSGLIRKACDKQYLDKDAFGIFQKLARKSDKKLAITLAHLEHYIRVGGLEERATRQGDMIGQEAELAETNVVDIKANGGRKKRAEKAETKAEKAARLKHAPKFESQAAREAAAEFDPADGEAVHWSLSSQ